MTFHTDNFQFRWKNFRAFEDTGWVTLRPFTILIGPNNSGKTSLISPLLLMAQTLSSPDPISPLVTTGPLVDVGPYREFIRGKNLEHDLGLAFRFHPHKPTKSPEPVGAYPPGGISVVLKSADAPSGMILSSFELEDVYGRTLLTQRRQRNGSYNLPGSLYAELTNEEKAAIKESHPVNFMFSPSLVLKELNDETRDVSPQSRRRPKGPESFSKSFSTYLSSIGFTYSGLHELLRSINYAAPLRERPKRIYEFSREIPNHVGPRGESMAHFLSHFIDEFQEELDRWVRIFEFGDGLRLRKIDDIGGSLFFKKNGDDFHTNIAHTGFGASQVLPLIVQTIMAADDNILIAEQPELHLNPRLQAKLGLLFAEAVSAGRRVIVETHSEHFLLAVRTLIAEGKLSASDVSLMFIETEDQRAKIKTVRIDDDGGIDRDEWPKGFLGESLQQALALSSAQAKRLSAK